MQQTAASGIPEVCTAIREGRRPTFAASGTSGVSFLEAAAGEVGDTAIDVIERLGGCGMRKWPGRSNAVPGCAGHQQPPAHASHCGAARLQGWFYEGKPVTLTKTNYDLNVRNGELGEVLGDTTNGLRIRFFIGEVELPATELGNLELAYALTCHRAQKGHSQKWWCR
jgi:hypothetical protein